MKGGDSIKLLFLPNNLLDPNMRRKTKIPLYFFSFAHIRAKLYRFNKNTITVQNVGSHGNDVIYGGLFILTDEYFHLRTLDALHNCSKSSLGNNHSLDLQHRVSGYATPLSFSSMDELSRLLYKELEPVPVEFYVGNHKHPLVKKRIERTQKFNYRIRDGILTEAFKNQHRREQELAGE